MEKLNLVKDRKFGDNISMAFDFISANIANTKNVIIYLLILGLAGGICSIIPIVGTVIAFVIQINATILATTFVICYMKQYTESSDGRVDAENVMTETKANMVKVFVGNLVYGIAVAIGFILLFVPGMFIMVACIFVGFCIVNYKLGTVDGLKKSHELVKNNWWVTLGYILVVGIILNIISALFILLGGALTFLGTAGIAIGSALTYVISFLVNLITFFALGVHYYNLVDKKEGVNVATQIDSIGQN